MKNRMEPRIAKSCIQALANIACDHDESDTSGAGHEFLELDGVGTTSRLMSRHHKDPRLLEDALCLLSNVAFVSEEVQL